MKEIGWKRVSNKYDENLRLQWVETKGSINYATFRGKASLATCAL